MKFGRGKSEASTPTELVELPERSDALILSIKYGDKLPARVLERGVNSLLVAITVPSKRLSPRDLEGLVLEYAGANGRVRLAGTVSVEDPKEPDVLRMDALRAVEVLQEREFVRIMAARPVRVYLGKELQPIESFTIDISGGGFLLAGPETLRIGERVQFHLSIIPGEEPITGAAKIVRSDASGHRGVAFEEISDADRTRLVHFIFECQRSELRRGLNHGG
jgi:PilZ domain